MKSLGENHGNQMTNVKHVMTERCDLEGAPRMSTHAFRRAVLLLVTLLIAAGSWLARQQLAAKPTARPPSLHNTCLITGDVKRLTDFYSRVLQVKPQASGDEYVEFPTAVGTLAIFDPRRRKNTSRDRRRPQETK